MTRTREHKALYVILGIGTIFTFFGHGMWAIRGKESFIALFTGTFDNIGIDVSAATGETWVKAIGWFDLGVAAVMAALVVGAILERGTLYRAAYSNLAVVVFAWGVVWGFLTALSRVTSADEFYPEVWDWVERAPNWMLPAALVYVVLRHRTLIIPSHAPSERVLTEV